MGTAPQSPPTLPSTAFASRSPQWSYQEIEQVIRLTKRDEVQELKLALERERKDVEKRMANITADIEVDGVGTLLTRLRELEERHRAIGEQLRNLRPIPRLAPEVIEDRLAELKKLLAGPIQFSPVREDGERYYTFRAPIAPDRLIAGTVGCATVVASPRALAPFRNPRMSVGIDFAGVLKVACPL